MPDVARSRSFRDETSDRRRRDKQERPSDRNGDDDDDDDAVDVDDDDGAAGAKLPRSVSFNRDVRIKRIGPRETSRPIPPLTATSPVPLASNGSVQPSTARPSVRPVRRERLRHLSERQLADEAARVLEQVGRVNCVSEDNGVVPERFYSLPNRGRKQRVNKIGGNGSPTSSIDTRPRRRSEEIGATTPGPKKPPRTFLSRSASAPKRGTPSKGSLATLFGKGPALHRSKSDVSEERVGQRSGPSRRADGDVARCKKKTQLSPIIEASPPTFEARATNGRRSERMTARTAVEPDAVVKIERRAKRGAGLRETFRALTRGRRDDEKENARPDDDEIGKIVRELQETVRAVEASDEMIHGGRKPAERTRPTRGHRVDDMVRRLSRDKFTPPPRSARAAPVSPTLGTRHNNNRPFSYTNPSSPERAYDARASAAFGERARSSSPELGSSGAYHRSPSPRPGDALDRDGQVIYAQVVCGGAPDAKRTVRASYAPRRTPPHHSDSDEGLGYEETKWRPRDDDDDDDDETPIRPRYTHRATSTSFADVRGRADGMDAIKRRDSVTERADLLNGIRGDLSSRREQLESRINSRTLQRANPTGRTERETFERRYTSETSFCRDGEPLARRLDSPEPPAPTSTAPGKLYERSCRTSRATKYVAQSERLVKSREKEHHRSNPELIHDDGAATVEDGYGSYHDSLRRQQRRPPHPPTTTPHDESPRGKDRFVDSGIENDIRRDSGERVRVVVSRASDDEDEGFASSLLIASERQHTEENVEARRRERDGRRGRGGRGEYVPRERSIDDGSHFDPRIDRDVDGGTLKRVVDRKPPKAEKKISGLDKVRNLFSSKKTKEKRKAERLENEIMVKEEEMRARYREYKGSTEQLDVKTDLDHSGRKRLATPRSSPTPTSQRKLTKESKSSNLSVPSTTTTTTTTKENGWFKSLDRLGRRNKDKTTTTRPPSSKITDKTISEDENYTRYYQPNKTKKSLRFFGDTDVESDASLRYKTSLKHRPSLNASGSEQRSHGPAKRSHSHRDLHNIEETQREHRHVDVDDDDDDDDEDFDASTTRRRHKSLQSFDTVDAPRRRHRHDDRDDDEDASRLSLKPPISPSRRGVAPKRHDAVDGAATTARKAKKNDVSSVESSTEGDSSQQSQKSVVYLHAATVGDIPSPGDRFRRSASREEIDSIGSSRIRPRTKTLSRSFSVLAPWRPKHAKERLDIDYSQQPKPRSAGRTSSVKTKIEKNRAREETGGSTLRRHRSSQSLSKSRENVTAAAAATTPRRRDDRDDVRGSNSTLFRKQKDRRGGGEKKKQQQLDAKKSMSLESLGGGGGGGSKTLRTRHTKHEERVSRSKSMPKDNDRPAGWFRKSKTTTEPTRG